MSKWVARKLTELFSRSGENRLQEVLDTICRNPEYRRLYDIAEQIGIPVQLKNGYCYHIEQNQQKAIQLNKKDPPRLQAAGLVHELEHFKQDLMGLLFVTPFELLSYPDEDFHILDALGRHQQLLICEAHARIRQKEFMDESGISLEDIKFKKIPYEEFKNYEKFKSSGLPPMPAMIKAIAANNRHYPEEYLNTLKARIQRTGISPEELGKRMVPLKIEMIAPLLQGDVKAAATLEDPSFWLDGIFEYQERSFIGHTNKFFDYCPETADMALPSTMSALHLNTKDEPFKGNALPALTAS